MGLPRTAERLPLVVLWRRLDLYTGGAAMLLLAGIVATLFAVPTPAHAQAVKSIYCCDDENGRPICGDVLPSACFGRAYREMSPQGAVRRYVDAPLSREERARRAEAERLEREEAARLLVQRRLDEALFETYPSLEAIDEREARALAEIERSVADVRLREQELQEQRKRYEQEAEFYQGRDMPRELENALRSVDTEMAAYRSVIDSKDAEKDALRERFAADRKRYAELLASGFSRR